MKALVLYEKKDGSTELREVPRPEIGPGDVLIKVKAAAICGADIEFYRAKQIAPLRPPVTLGHEFCGVVEEVGPQVTAWKAGDRVVSENTGYVCGTCFACQAGQYLLCPERLGLGYSMDGGFAEYVRIPEQILQRMPDCLHRLPDLLSFQEGAILEPSANSYKTVIQEGGLMAGETIAIFGPGPIGIFCVQLAKIAGASQIILIGRSSSRMRLDLAKCFGADEIVVADQQDVRAAIHSATEGEGVDLAIDAAGAEDVIAHAMQVIRPLGRIVRIAWSNASQTINLDPLSNRAGTIQGHFGYDSVSWRNVLRLAEKGMLQYKPMISKVFSLDQWQEAFEMVEEKKVLKAVFEF